MTVARKAGGMSPLLAAGVVGAVLGVSAWVGRRNAPEPSHPHINRWYHRLRQPPFTPPDAVFGAAWPILETGMAVGGYRLLRQPAAPARNAAVVLWLGNAAMIGGWTELFFRRHQLGSSALASGAMVAGTGAYVAAARKADPVAAATAVPLLAWLGFATVLAEEVWRRNSDDEER
jgi:benzodiazapine receptor